MPKNDSVIKTDDIYISTGTEKLLWLAEWSDSKKILTLKPAKEWTALVCECSYEVVIEGATDRAGNKADLSANFSTLPVGIDEWWWHKKVPKPAGAWLFD